MNRIDIAELERFAVGEGLSAARRAEIAQALLDSDELRARYEALTRMLGDTAAMVSTVEPDDGFEARLWACIAPRIDASASSTELAAVPATSRELAPVIALPTSPRRRLSPAWRSLALAASLIAAVGLGIVIGRQPNSTTTASPDTALLDGDASDRVLAGYLVNHLGSAEAVFTRVASEGDDAEVRELAAQVIATNRLYAAAAERAHRPDLAQFLREIEPVLAELATGEETSEHVVAEVRDRDLAFKTRVVADKARRRAGPANTPI